MRHKKDGKGRGRGGGGHNTGFRGQNDTDRPDGATKRPPFKAAAWDLNHCDAKRCSGKRLMRLGLMRELHVGQKHPGIVISPKAKTIVNPSDREVLEQYGAAVIEASWNRIEEVPWALAACFAICGHHDWAEEILSTFSYGQAFLDINEAVLKRYAACEDEEGVKKAEEVWLAKIENEWREDREEREENKDDAWRGGNLNRRQIDVDDNEEEGSGDDSDASSMGGIQLGGPKVGEQPGVGDGEEDDEERDPFALPPSDDEEEMAELRRRVLASKPFANASKSTPEADYEVPERIQRPADPSKPVQNIPEDSDAESGSEIGGEDADFDNIMNAAPVTDRAGITAAQRKRAMEKEGKLSATFSRAVVNAPGKWPP
ncbi:ribosome biogenesis protein tsr3 [Elasticomyces elasticus]|nr:ribosome biogenesis protein tsr3 [Elasticomyces elasticus]KAK4903698.1 ribosome biogenesis protein tsr3 [Elasticomyces elasticus]KAK5737736.1 ribosome biogenesis protein tsr3 [Elasticomyces elasticus]